MKRFRGIPLFSLALVAVVWFACPGPVAAEEGESVLPSDVVGQFNALKHQGEWLGFRLGDAKFDYGADKHNQGISRCQGTDCPWLLVTRSVHSAADTTVLMVRMGTRTGTAGERLRSNRLWDQAETYRTVPSAADSVYHLLKAPEQDWGMAKPGWYVHVGATQIADGIAPLPLEKPTHPFRDPPGKIVFLDVEDLPSRPVYLDYEMGLEHGAGTVALTKLPDGSYLMALTWGAGREVRFYKSAVSDLRLLNEAEGRVFEPYDTMYASEVDGEWPTQGVEIWTPWGPKKVDSTFQTINFVRQSNGQLFLVGFMNTYNTSPLIPGSDIGFLYEVTGFEGKPGTQHTVHLRAVSKRGFRVGVSGRGQQTYFANFNAGTGVYVSPTGELLFYAVEHYDNRSDDFVNMAEYRHRDVYRPDSPNYAPKLRWKSGYGAWEVPEGASVVLQGSYALEPLARAWAEIYSDNGYQDISVVLDVVDRHRENWNHLSTFDQGNERTFWGPKDGFNDHADSVRWFAPWGSTFQLHKHAPPGGKTLSLYGIGKPTGISKLDDVDMGDTVSAVTFDGREYGRVVSSRWEIRTNPTLGILRDPLSDAPVYEAVDGKYVDGESSVELIDRVATSGFLHPGNVPATARHTARVTVRNVVPAVTIDRIADQTGRDATGSPPALIAGTEYVLFGHFSDPGIEDTHTATVVWGDGFESHSGEVHCVLWDSLGGETGLVYMPHVYDAWGPHDTVLQVTDDDGDTGESAWDVVVLGLEDVVKRCIVRLQNRLYQGGLDRRAERSLRRALAKLDGANQGATKNGAVHYLGSGHTHLALLRVLQTLKHFAAALEADARVDGSIRDCRHLLTLGVKGLVWREVRNANERVDSWRDLKFVMDAENLVSHGDSSFAGGAHATAVARYRTAYKNARKVR